MKGKNYLLITGILIIVAALAGFLLNSSSFLFPKSWSIPKYIGTGVSLFLFITGLFGILFRKRHAFICIIFGVIVGVCSVVSIPFMFWIGNGSAPIGMLLSSLGIIIVLAFYLEGAIMNRRTKVSKF